MIQKSLTTDSQGALCFAGARIADIAEKYGTPAYMLDEDRLRENMRAYTSSMREAFGGKSFPTYASKALCFKGIYEILNQEGFGADVVSGGELYTALKAGFPMDKVYFHGNHKSDMEIALAMDSGVGCWMIDNPYELERVGAEAVRRGRTVRAILRLTPGIDPHTFAAVNTGKMDCQFGEPVETGQAMEFVGAALKTQGIEVAGLHCHIGSQIFGFEPFALAVAKMLDFIAQAKERFSWEPEWLDLGGGFGVRYVEDDPFVNIPACIKELGEIIDGMCAGKGIKKPNIIMEPGRSIVADAGATVYRAGAIKEIKDHRTYIVVDGGMTDDPRYALYRSKYTVYNASRPLAAADCLYSVAGRCCESGALLQEDVKLPLTKSGDLIVFGVTGAYNYSMASNYNRVPRLPIVMVSGGKTRLAVRRETLDDLLKCDL